MNIRFPGSLVLALFLSAAAANAQAQSSLYPMVEKWTEPRIFHEPFRPEFERQVVIHSRRVFPETLPGGERVRSPNGGYWYLLDTADFSNAAPWSSQLYVYNDRVDLLRVELRNHGNASPRAYWINEKLLYISLWWSRALGSYMILDVERGIFVAREMFVDGTGLFKQYRQSNAYVR